MLRDLHFLFPLFLFFLLQGCGHSSTILPAPVAEEPKKNKAPTNISIPKGETFDWQTARRNRANALDRNPNPPVVPIPPPNFLTETNPEDPLDAFIQQIISISFGGGEGFGQEDMTFWLLGPPYGGGLFQGSTDVVALGNGGEIVVAFPKFFPIDGEGPDFIVFENAFTPQGSQTIFMEPGIVGVSQNGVQFIDYPCHLVSPFEGCAGTHAVFANPGLNNKNPRNPDEAGGDLFDLRDVGLKYIQFIRTRDANLNRGGLAAIDAGRAGFDLDAIAIVHGAKP